jgi:3-phenylpropionate/trans-cinnamate dioxygenase ferredoxin reductase subunit
LRQFGWAGPITLAGSEPHLPYHRPPLSKAWLQGTTDAESLLLRPAAFYADQAIDLLRGATAEAIDRTAGRVRLADGGSLAYDRLILALGAVPRRLAMPGHDLPGVLELRSRDDADRIRAALQPGRRLAVAGGGYIGLEVAASARALGLAVTVIEREKRLLARVASPALSAHVEARHRAEGVGFFLASGVEALEAAGGRVASVRLTDGRAVDCDAALIGVGGVPNTALAAQAGLACDDGILVDHTARTDDAAIYAIGDCTRRPLPLYGRIARLESVPNTTEQARQAAASLCGRPPPPAEVPWFWSDQFDMRLQIAGLPYDVDRLVPRGGPGLGVFHLDAEDRVQAVEAVDRPAEFAAGRMMILQRRKVDVGRLQNPAIALRDVFA